MRYKNTLTTLLFTIGISCNQTLNAIGLTEIRTHSNHERYLITANMAKNLWTNPDYIKQSNNSTVYSKLLQNDGLDIQIEYFDYNSDGLGIGDYVSIKDKTFQGTHLLHIDNKNSVTTLVHYDNDKNPNIYYYEENTQLSSYYFENIAKYLKQLEINNQ